MTSEERMQKIESYGKGYIQLTEALKQFPKEMWSFKPSPDRWSIHEIIVHIADSEANAYVKCRKLIAEPGKPISAYDQDKWSAAFHYQDQSAEEALELFRRLRLSSYNLVKALPEPVWLNSVGSQENETVAVDVVSSDNAPFDLIMPLHCSVSSVSWPRLLSVPTPQASVSRDSYLLQVK